MSHTEVRSSLHQSQPAPMELSGLYFAYGTDMAREVLKARGGKPQVAGIAKLSNFRVGFFGYVETWDSGLETVVEEAGAEAWGVLYEMGSLDWERLDDWMGARMDGAGMYFHFPTAVTDSHGVRHQVRLYRKDIQGTETIPSREYLELMLQGAEQNSLPTAYVEQLRNRDSRRATFPVPAAGNRRRAIGAAVDCRACDVGSNDASPLIPLRKVTK